MWTREQLKTRGKFSFRANYWKAVLIALVLTFIVGGSMQLGGGFGGPFGAASATGGALSSAIEDSDVNVYDDDGMI